MSTMSTHPTLFHHPHPYRRRLALSLGLALTASGLALGAPAARADTAPAPANITVSINAGSTVVRASCDSNGQPTGLFDAMAMLHVTVTDAAGQPMDMRPQRSDLLGGWDKMSWDDGWSRLSHNWYQDEFWPVAPGEYEMPVETRELSFDGTTPVRQTLTVAVDEGEAYLNHTTPLTGSTEWTIDPVTSAPCLGSDRYLKVTSHPSAFPGWTQIDIQPMAAPGIPSSFVVDEEELLWSYNWGAVIVPRGVNVFDAGLTGLGQWSVLVTTDRATSATVWVLCTHYYCYGSNASVVAHIDPAGRAPGVSSLTLNPPTAVGCVNGQAAGYQATGELHLVDKLGQPVTDPVPQPPYFWPGSQSPGGTADLVVGFHRDGDPYRSSLVLQPPDPVTGAVRPDSYDLKETAPGVYDIVINAATPGTYTLTPTASEAGVYEINPIPNATFTLDPTTAPCPPDPAPWWSQVQTLIQQFLDLLRQLLTSLTFFRL